MKKIIRQSLFLLLLLFQQGQAQDCANCYDGCLLEPGELFITCGSGQATNNSVEVQQNLAEPVLAIWDANDPAANGATLGVDWPTPAANGFYGGSWTAQDLGEVFGIELKPNQTTGCQDIYVTQWGIIPGGIFETTFYEGDLANSCDGGAVFKVDGTTGAVSVFACLPSHTGALPAEVFVEGSGFSIATQNTYTGLGQITYNKDCDVFYVSNFEDGLIYTLDANGGIVGTYDFGVDGLPGVFANDGSLPGNLSLVVDGNNQYADNPADDLTYWARRTFAVAYNKHDEKLYFSALSKTQPTNDADIVVDGVDQFIYSVDIDPTSCNAIASTTQLQATVDQGNRSPVSDITFSIDNKMLVSQMALTNISTKGAHDADVLEFSGGDGAWAQSAFWITSTYSPSGGSGGGSDYTYNNYGTNPDEAGGNCPEDGIVLTVDAALGINEPAIYGLEIQPLGGGDVATDAYLIDGDDNLQIRQKFVFADVEGINPGCNLTTLNLVCLGDGSFTVEPDCVQDILCDYTVSTNNGTLDATTGNPCAVSTFNLSDADCAIATEITVTINSCDGSKLCTLTEALAACCVEPIYDVRLGKTVDANMSTVGSPVVFTLTVYNESDAGEVTGVEVTDLLPTGLTYDSDNSGGNYDSVTGIWTIGTIAMGDSATIEITALVAETGVFVNQAEISAMDQVDTDSTPDNNDPNEDDISSACVSIPIEVCDNEAISIDIVAEAGFANYQWYKDGVLIAGASSQTYTATEGGTYTYTVDGAGPTGDCQGELCCPIVIETVSCCPPINCLPVIVTKLEE